MARKSHGGDMSPEAPIRLDILSASTTAGSQDRQSVRDLLLVALTVASGAVDAISYFGLGKIFSAFMTGNLVFLGFGIAEIEGPDVVPVIVALSMFTVGAYFGLRFTTLRSNESGLWSPAVTVLLVLVAVAEASFLVAWLSTAEHPSTGIVDVLIALFSLAMGIQTAAVRSLGVQGIFTTAGTFTLVAFAGTFAGSRSRSEMPRLVGVLLGLVAGAVAGGLLFLHARSYAPALPLVITVLVILAGRSMQRSRAALGETHGGANQATPEVKAHSASRTRRASAHEH
ncbi:MAG TPA: YoaK family protein [Mycobacterium sp.]|nr:YoaK family protein [Mycobacterium sp.]